MKSEHTNKRCKHILVTLGFIAGGAGCTPYYKVLKEEFPQGIIQSVFDRSIIDRNIKTTGLYDQFTTELRAAALWMCDDVRRVYVQALWNKEGRKEEFKAEFLNAELQKNKHTISFYVAFTSPNNVDRMALHEKNPYWSLSLIMPDGTMRIPQGIKEIDEESSPIIESFFGRHFNGFRRLFLVTFPYTKDEFSAPNLNCLPDPCLSLRISSSLKQAPDLTWKLSGIPLAQKSEHEDFYWV